MKKISIIGHNDNKKEVLRRLASIGAVEITPPKELLGMDNGERDEAIAKLTKMSIRTKMAIETINLYDDRKTGFFPEKLSISRDEIFSETDRTYGYVKEINRNYEEMEYKKAEKIKAENEKEKLLPYFNWKYPIEKTKTKNMEFQIGFFGKDFSENELLEEIKNSLISECFLSKNLESVYYGFIIHKDSIEEFNEIMKRYGFSRLILTDEKGTIESIINKCTHKINNNVAKIAYYLENIKKYLGMKDRILKYYDMLTLRLELKKSENEMVHTKSAYMIDGYIPKSVGDDVKMVLERDFLVVATLEDVGEDEEFPVKISNNAIIEPYEFVTEMYSTPSSKGIDPSVFMAPFYFIFFGMMLSDAGYGILLTLITGFILFKYKPEGMTKKLISLLCMCGVSTTIWGFLYGSFFANITEILTGTNMKPIWFDPLADPMKLLLFSCALGIVHIMTGMAVKAYMLIKKGMVWDAVFDIGSWYLVFIGLGMLILPATKSIALYVVLLGVLSLILTQGRDKKNIFSRLASGLLSLYDATAFLSDILSYSRLLALGLATSVIGMVVNIMGSLGGKTWYGYIMLAIVFLAGHTFNIAINVLGAYVHSGRLMYIEFFGKFYESGGKVFKPLSIKNKYTKVN